MKLGDIRLSLDELAEALAHDNVHRTRMYVCQNSRIREPTCMECIIFYAVRKYGVNLDADQLTLW